MAGAGAGLQRVPGCGQPLALSFEVEAATGADDTRTYTGADSRTYTGGAYAPNLHQRQ